MKKQYPNYIRDQKNKLRERLNAQEESLKKIYESKTNYEDKYGKYPDLIKLGEKERLSGYEPQSIDDEDMKKSHEYGFFKRGSKALAGEFENGKFSAMEQREFGIMDLNNGLKDEDLFNLINYPNYMNGRIYQMGRNIYDYIEMNNLEIDEYISLMSIINPYVSYQEFKIGYNDQKEERANKKRR